MTPRDFDALLAMRTLVAHDVRFVIVGGIAARAWGSPSSTNDLDICYARTKENYRVLAAALRELEATLRGAAAGIPFLLDERTIAMGDSFTFETAAGSLDCLGTPSGTGGYNDLVGKATSIELEPNLTVAICSLEDLIRMKRAADRPKDRIEVEILTAVQEERARQGL